MTTHERWEIPPRSPTIVGSAVETIVWSSAASSSTSISAAKIARTRGCGCRPVSVTSGILPTNETIAMCNYSGAMSTAPDTTAILEQLGKLVRELSRITGGAEDGPALTATQRISLLEIADAGPLRLNDLAARIGSERPHGEPRGGRPRRPRPGRAQRGSRGPPGRADRAHTHGAAAGRRAQGPRCGRLRAGASPHSRASDRERLLLLLARLTAALSPEPGLPSPLRASATTRAAAPRPG